MHLQCKHVDLNWQVWVKVTAKIFHTDNLFQWIGKGSEKLNNANGQRVPVLFMVRKKQWPYKGKNKGKAKVLTMV